jgi:hypothetical protein
MGLDTEPNEMGSSLQHNFLFAVEALGRDGVHGLHSLTHTLITCYLSGRVIFRPSHSFGCIYPAANNLAVLVFVLSTWQWFCICSPDAGKSLLDIYTLLVAFLYLIYIALL